MTFNIEKTQQVVELILKIEAHAFVLLAAGVWLILAGHKDEGMMVLGGALGIFRGGKPA